MGKLFKKIVIFCCPYLIGVVAVACLPYNEFTFRFCEAMSVFANNSLLPGPYYPSVSMTMLEEGDLGHGTPYAVGKKVRWQTDEYGFRTTADNNMRDIVIVGDSFTAGYTLTQEETIAEVLRRRTGRAVYPYANRDINSLLADARFAAHKPKTVVFEQVENFIGTLTPRIDPQPKVYTHRDRKNELLVKAAVLMDRLKKMEPVHLVKSKFSRYVNYTHNCQGMLFSQSCGDAAVTDPRKLAEAIETIVGYDSYFSGKGIKFIYLPVPRKGNVYHDLIPNTPEPKFLPELVEKLESRGVTVINLSDAYRASRKRNVLLYHKDDTHWNAAGVEIAATAIAGQLER